MHEFLGRGKEQRIADASALDRFIQQVYWGETLQNGEAHRNLERGLIEILQYGRHSSNGLLITDNGYFLTPNHCVDGKSGLTVRDHDGRIFEVSEVCSAWPQEDIALTRAQVPGDAVARNYKLYSVNPEIGTPIAIRSRYDGVVRIQYGLLRRLENLRFKTMYGKEVSGSHFVLNIETRPGDSGGIVTTPDGRLIGFASTGGSRSGYGTCVSTMKALEVLHYYKSRLERMAK